MPSSENPSDAELIQLGIAGAMSRMFKAGPGIVRVYDPVTNTAFVQPAVKHARYSVTDDKRSYAALPEIPFVPVIFPRSGGFVMRAPVLPGDTVLLIYCDSSLAEWRESGGVTEPQDARLHSLGWPVAIPGFFPDSSPMDPLDSAEVATGTMIVGEDGGENRIAIGGTPLTRGDHLMTVEACALLIYNVLVALIAASGAGPLVGATLQPLLGMAVNTALAAQAAPAPPGAVAQTTAAAALLAGFATGTTPSNTSAFFAAAIAALATKTHNESGLFPSLGAKAVKAT